MSVSFNEFQVPDHTSYALHWREWMDYAFRFIVIMQSQKVLSGLSGGYRINYTIAPIKYDTVQRSTLNTHSCQTLALSFSLYACGGLNSESQLIT